MPNELKVLSARAVKAAVSAVAQRFSHDTGCAMAFDFAPVGAIEKKLAEGARGDVVILSESAIATLDKAGALVPGSSHLLGRTSIGVCVRDGAAQPDIATPEKFVALLRAVKSIALSDVAVGGTAARYLPQLFERIGLTAELEPKLVRCAGGGDVTERVARGEAEIGITFVSEMRAVSGATVIGALPDAYGNDTTYYGAVMIASARPHDAGALIAALAAPSVREVWRTAGFA